MIFLWLMDALSVRKARISSRENNHKREKAEAALGEG